MNPSKTSRRTLIFGAATTAVAVPAAALITPETVLAAAAETPAGKSRRGPAHDWLDDFVMKNRHRVNRPGQGQP